MCWWEEARGAGARRGCWAGSLSCVHRLVHYKPKDPDPARSGVERVLRRVGKQFKELPTKQAEEGQGEAQYDDETMRRTGFRWAARV